MACLDDALQAAEQETKNLEAGMKDMFGELVETTGGADVYTIYRKVRPWPAKQRLEGEKETLGLYVTGHPIDEYERELRKFAPCRIADLRADGSRNQVIAGLVVATRTMKTRRGDTMAVLQLDDRSARIEATVFAEAYNEYRELLVKDSILILEGAVAHDDYSGGLSMRANSVRSMLQARQNYAAELLIELRDDMVDDVFTDRLQQLLRHAGEGQCPVSVWYSQAENRARIQLGSDWRVSPSDELIQQLQDCCGSGSVSLSYPG
jgi:DNA polymerase-3 subunit alpha